MSTEIAVRPRDNDQRLSDLARQINEEHAAVGRAVLSALEHAIIAGELLAEARTLCSDYGTWYPWLAEHFDGHESTASTYMRLAHYKEIVLRRPWETGNALTKSTGRKLSEITLAHQYLRGLPAVRSSGQGFNETFKEEARTLRARGATYEEISSLLGISKTSAANWCDPRRAAKHGSTSARIARRRREQRKLAKIVARENAIAKIKGPSSEAYSLLRKAALLLERAASEAADPLVRGHYNAALRRLYGVEDEIVSGLGVE